MKARHAVGCLRARTACDRTTAIKGAEISEEHQTLFSNAGEKRLCNPHMKADPMCGQWISIVQTARSVADMLFMAAMLVLFASRGACDALCNRNLLQLDEDAESWQNRFRSAAFETTGSGGCGAEFPVYQWCQYGIINTTTTIGIGPGFGIGTGIGSGTGSGSGSGTGTGIGIGTGSGIGTGLGTGSGSGIGSGTGTGIGTGAGTGKGIAIGTRLNKVLMHAKASLALI
eukprot:12431491-Karenia_brevis.AAC.1